MAAAERSERSATLADDLRSRSNDQLAALLRARPDLLQPPSNDLGQLATRLSSRPSVALAIDGLTALERQVLEVAVAACSPSPSLTVSGDELGELLGLASEPPMPAGPVQGPDSLPHHEPSDPALLDADSRGLVENALQRLYDLALVWGSPGFRPVQGAMAAFGPYPCGLEPNSNADQPPIHAYLSEPRMLQTTLEGAPDKAREVLDQLLWDSPRGAVANADRAVTASSAGTPIEWLLARHLLLPTGSSEVTLPREVALALRGGRYVRRPDLPPAVTVTKPLLGFRADQAAGMTALQIARRASDLLAALDDLQPSNLRAGGIPVRDVTTLSTRIGLQPTATAWLLAVLAQAHLLALDPASETWLPTPLGDQWQRAQEARQWATLAVATLSCSAIIDPAGAESRTGALGQTLQQPWARAARLALAESLTALPEHADTVSVIDHAAWLRSCLADPIRSSATSLLNQLAAVGLTAGSQPAPTLRAAVAASGAADPEQIDALANSAEAILPALVDRLIFQADLTAIAPGPLSRTALERIMAVATPESIADAAVFRADPARIRTQLDRGRNAADLVDDLTNLGGTPLPHLWAQTIADVERTHGGLLVSAATTIVRATDQSELAAALADRRLGVLRLHRLTDTVASSPLPPTEVLDTLRRAGFAPTAEGELARTVQPRPARARVLAPTTTSVSPDEVLAAAVRSLRSGDRTRLATGTAGRGFTRLSPNALTETLQAKIKDRAPILLDYVEQTGQRVPRLVEPLTLRVGSLTGFDHREQVVRAFSLARIAGLAEPATMEE